MTTAIAEPTKTTTLAADDVIDPNQYYGAAAIETLLAIPPREFLAAIHQMNYGYQGDSNLHGGVSGVDVLRCIAKHDLKHRVTTFAREMWARTHRPPVVETPEPEARDLASRILRQADSQAASERAEDDDRNRNATDALLKAVYQTVGEGKDEVAQLARMHLPDGHIKASNDDVRDCTDAMLDLKIDAEQFREYVEAMCRALTQTILHDGLAAALKESVAAREAHVQFLKDTEKKERELFRAKVAAASILRAAKNAPQKLEMARRCLPPEFFDGSSPRKLTG